MRKILVLLSALVLCIVGLASPASANATTGQHFDTFSCVPSAAPSESGTLNISYHVGRLTDGTWWLTFDTAQWTTSPARLLNALRLDLENSSGNYIEISPPWGNSSATHDDVSSSFNQTRDTVASWPTGTTGDYKTWFANNNTPNLRLRCYGMGAGDTPNDAGHNDVVYRPVQ